MGCHHLYSRASLFSTGSLFFSLYLAGSSATVYGPGEAEAECVLLEQRQSRMLSSARGVGSYDMTGPAKAGASVTHYTLPPCKETTAFKLCVVGGSSTAYDKIQCRPPRSLYLEIEI